MSEPIPAEAVEAAAKVMWHRPHVHVVRREDIIAALEAAAPHMFERVRVGDVELVAYDVTRVGDTISYNGQLYVRARDTTK